MAAIASNLIGKGEYGEVKITQVAGVKFALKTTKLPTYPNELETIMACCREEAMTLRHKHIIERIWCRFWNGQFQNCMELGVPVGQAPGKQVLEEIGQALYFMHSKGFVHRDVKPDNIVRVGNTLKLIDFGLTRQGDGRTEMSSYMITRWYRPPEMLRICEDFDKIQYDGRCDMWSLALTAYHIQNGKPLFYGETERILSMYAKFKKVSSGLFSHLLCEYEDRWTAKQMLKSHNIPLIEGTIEEVRPRDGIVAEYVQAMLKGDDETISSIGYKGIHKEL